MKLLSISTDRKMFEPGSAVALRQIERAREMQELHIIVFAGREFKEMNIAPNVWIYPTRSVSRWLYPFDAARLGRFIVERRGITHITFQDASLTAMAGVSLKKRFNLLLEIQIHEDLGSPHYTFNFINRIRKSLALSHLPKADSIRVVSERIKDYLIKSIGIDPTRIAVKPIPVDTEIIKNAPITIDLHKKYPQFEKIVLMASRLEVEKNIELAIKAWQEVVKKVPTAGLVIVGSGSRRSALENLVSRLGMRSSVVFEEWVNRGTLASYYKTADLFLVTSLFEGYGMTFVEARAAGCPIISTDVGVAREQGAIIIPWDAGALSEALVYRLAGSQ